MESVKQREAEIFRQLVNAGRLGGLVDALKDREGYEPLISPAEKTGEIAVAATTHITK